MGLHALQGPFLRPNPAKPMPRRSSHVERPIDVKILERLMVRTLHGPSHRDAVSYRLLPNLQDRAEPSLGK